MSFYEITSFMKRHEIDICLHPINIFAEIYFVPLHKSVTWMGWSKRLGLRMLSNLSQTTQQHMQPQGNLLWRGILLFHGLLVLHIAWISCQRTFGRLDGSKVWLRMLNILPNLSTTILYLGLFFDEKTHKWQGDCVTKSDMICQPLIHFAKHFSRNSSFEANICV